MEISELQTLVRARFDGVRRALSLPAADLRSPRITDLARAFLGGDTLVVTEATLDLTPSGASVTGALEGAFLSTTPLAVRAEFTVERDDAALVVTISGFPVGWRLSDSLASLAGTIADAFEYADVTFTLDSLDRDGLADDFETVLGFSAPSEAIERRATGGLRIACTVSAGDALGNLRWLFAGDSVRLAGPVETIDGAYRMLLASEPFDAVELGSLRVPGELEIASFFVDAEGAPSGFVALTVARINATFARSTEGGEVSVPVSAIVRGGDLAVVRFEGDVTPPVPLRFSEIASFLESAVVDDLRPTSNGFPPLDALSLESVGFAFAISGTPRIADVSVGLRLDREWSVFGGMFRFHEPHLLFLVSNPTLAPSLSASMDCAVDFAGSTFDAFVRLPELVFGLELEEGRTFDVAALVRSLLPGPLDLPAMTCSSLRLSGDVRAGTFSFLATLDDEWTLYGGGGQPSLALANLMLAVEYASGGQVRGEIRATMTLAGAALDVTVTHANAVDGWTLEATSTDREKIDLGGLVREVFDLFGLDLPDHLPDVTLKNLYVYHNTSTGALGVRGENEVASQVRLGDVVHDVDTYLDMLVERDQHNGGHTYTGRLRGSLTLGSAEFDVGWDFGSEDVLRGSWDASGGGSLEFTDLAASHGIDHDLTSPTGAIGLSRAAFEFDLSKSRFLLSADSNHYGEAFFVASNANDRWDFVFGVAADVSDVPGFPDLGALAIRDSSVILSTVRDDAFRVPSLPALAASGDASPSQRRVFPGLGSSSTPIAPGVTVTAVLDFDASGGGPVMSNVRGLIGTTELLVQVRISDTIVGSALRGYLAGSLVLPGAGGQSIVLSNPYVQIELEPLGVMVAGSVLVPVQDVTLEADGAMAITDEEMQAIFDVRAEVDGRPASLPFPFGLRGVRLDELAVAVGMVFEPPGVDLGLEGMFNVIGQPAGANAFTLVLELEGDVPNPLYLSVYFASLTLADTMTAVTGETVPLPSILNELRAEDLLLYWSETPGLVLPDGTLTQSGFGFNGVMALGGFDTHSGFSLSALTGVSGDAQMAPIDLHGVLKVEGDGVGVTVLQELVDGEWRTIRDVGGAGSGGAETRSYQIVAAGGPTISFSSKRSPFVDVSARVSLFNLVGVEVEIVVAIDRFTFELAGHIGDAVHFAYDCSLSASGFAASTSFDLGISGEIGPLTIAGVDLGSIRLDVSVAAEMSVAIDASGVTIGVGGKFWFDDFHLTLPTLTLHEDLRSLEDLPGLLLQHIRDLASEIFADVFDVAERLLEDAEAEARAIGDAVVDEVNQIGDAATADAQRIASEAEATYAGVVSGARDAEQAAQALDHDATQIASAAAAEAAQIGQAAEQEATQIAAQAQQAIDGAVAEVAEIGRVTEQEVENLANQAGAAVSAAADEVARIGDEAEREAAAIVDDARNVATSLVDDAEVAAEAIRAEAQRVLDEIAEAAREAAAWVERQAESAWSSIKKY